VSELLKILGVFALIVVLLRLRWHLGIVMLLAAAALGALMGMTPAGVLESAWHASTERAAVSLLAALALIMVLEHILRTTGTLKALVDSLQGLLGDNRVVMGLMPAIIGLLPSAGGARFSAPLVEESANGCVIDPERKSYINYLFRHVWEYVSPLYPGFILTATIAAVSMSSLFAWQASFTLTVLVIGSLVGFRGVETHPRHTGRTRRHDLLTATKSFAPILAAIVLVVGFGIDIAVSMAIVVGAMLIAHRYGARETWTAVRESVSFKTLLLVLGVLVFKGVMEDSGAVEHLPQALESAGVPVLVVLVSLPFLVGLMTGLTVAYVGVAFPLILPLIQGGDGVDMGLLALATAAGFAGVMFSPVHLCLVLTRDYFGARLTPIYSMLAFPEAAVIAVALLQVAAF
jgi:integral membrane protein (TIGR00529 family)